MRTGVGSSRTGSMSSVLQYSLKLRYVGAGHEAAVDEDRRAPWSAQKLKNMKFECRLRRNSCSVELTCGVEQGERATVCIGEGSKFSTFTHLEVLHFHPSRSSPLFTRLEVLHFSPVSKFSTFHPSRSSGPLHVTTEPSSFTEARCRGAHRADSGRVVLGSPEEGQAPATTQLPAPFPHAPVLDIPPQVSAVCTGSPR